jgi:hypothetical protein
MDFSVIWSTENWRPSRLVCSDTTRPTLAKILQENNDPRRDAGSWKSFGRSIKAWQPIYGRLLMKGYSGDRVEIDRATEQSVILNQTESGCLKLGLRSPAWRSTQTRRPRFKSPADEDSAWRRGVPDSLTSRHPKTLVFGRDRQGFGESSGPTPNDPAIRGLAQSLRGVAGCPR